MAYPTVKATTTHLDAGTDSPSQARSQIKQNIDNVNALIDHFNGSGPISIQGNEITSTRSNDDLQISVSGTGKITTGDAVNMHSLGRLIITDQASGTFSTEGSSSIGMLYNNGIQVEAAGAYEYPALVLKTHSVNGYPNIWASRSRNNTFGQNTHLNSGDTIFKFFGAGFDGADYNTAHCTVDFLASENHTGSAQGGKIILSNTTNGTKTNVVRMTVDDDITSEVQHAFAKNYTENISALTSAITIAVDCTTSSFFSCTLEHDARFVITDLPTGGSVTLIITQDSSGNQTGSFESSDSSAVKFSVGTPTLSTGNGDIDVVTIFNDGVNFLGSIAKNFRTGT